MRYNGQIWPNMVGHGSLVWVTMGRIMGGHVSLVWMAMQEEYVWPWEPSMGDHDSLVWVAMAATMCGHGGQYVRSWGSVWVDMGLVWVVMGVSMCGHGGHYVWSWESGMDGHARRVCLAMGAQYGWPWRPNMNAHSWLVTSMAIHAVQNDTTCIYVGTCIQCMCPLVSKGWIMAKQT